MAKNRMLIMADAVGIARAHGIDIESCATPAAMFDFVIEEIGTRARRAKTDVKKLEQLATDWSETWPAGSTAGNTETAGLNGQAAA